MAAAADMHTIYQKITDADRYISERDPLCMVGLTCIPFSTPSSLLVDTFDYLAHQNSHSYIAQVVTRLDYSIRLYGDRILLFVIYAHAASLSLILKLLDFDMNH